MNMNSNEHDNDGASSCTAQCSAFISYRIQERVPAHPDLLVQVFDVWL